jgi:hypothetical protein
VLVDLAIGQRRQCDGLALDGLVLLPDRFVGVLIGSPSLFLLISRSGIRLRGVSLSNSFFQFSSARSRFGFTLFAQRVEGKRSGGERERNGPNQGAPCDGASVGELSRLLALGRVPFIQMRLVRPRDEVLFPQCPSLFRSGGKMARPTG